MLKKNIAKAMAAATVLTAAAPMANVVFADVVENTQAEEVKAIKEKAFKLMNKKFTTDKNLLRNNGEGGTSNVAGQNVYQVTLTVDGTPSTPYNSYAEFEREFDKAFNRLDEGQSIKVNYAYAQKEQDGSTLVGYSTLEDGTVVDFETIKYTEQTLDAETKGDNVGDVKVTNGVDGSKKYEVRLSNDEEGFKRYQEIKAGELDLDLTKPVLREKDGYYVDIKGDAIVAVGKDVLTLNAGVPQINGTATPNAIVDGFYLDKTKPADNSSTILSDVIVKKGYEEVEFNSTDLFNAEESRLTVKGNDLHRTLQKLNYDLYDTDYTVTATETVEDREITIVVEKREKGEAASENAKVAQIKITRNAEDKKGAAYLAIKDLFVTSPAVIGNKIMVAAGADRYETAAEVSRKGFTTLTNEKAIVLVTGEQGKLVDGLTATPLAAMLNGGDGAPVLLTGNNKIAQPVLDEIERLSAEKVYIVGGAISEDVEKELKTVYGMKVERVSGDDRYETSLEVANKMLDVDGDGNKTPFTDVFVVGGKGEADALSAGSVAAKLNAPILLTQADKLNADVKYFLDKGTNDAANTKTYVVGGTSSVSEATYNQVLDIQGKNNIKRLAGAGRQETNAAVIEEFYTGKTNVQGALDEGNNITASKVVVAKSDNKGMVDALGAGLYAGVNDAPVVLATNSLVESQEDALKKITVGTNAQTVNKLQVGNGIAAAVAKFIKGL